MGRTFEIWQVNSWTMFFININFFSVLKCRNVFWKKMVEKRLIHFHFFFKASTTSLFRFFFWYKMLQVFTTNLFFYSSKFEIAPYLVSAEKVRIDFAPFSLGKNRILLFCAKFKFPNSLKPFFCSILTEKLANFKQLLFGNCSRYPSYLLQLIEFTEKTQATVFSERMCPQLLS